MPNIFQQNTNTLMNLSNKVDQDRQNALTMRKSELDMSNAERQTLMQNLYTVGRSADSVVDEESYQRWKGFIGTTYGQAAADKIPKSYDADGKDYVDQKKAESNILYESLGKGKPVEVPLYRMDGDKRIETKAIYGSPRFKDLMSGKRGHKWEQGHLVQSPSKQRTPDEEVDVYTRKLQAEKKIFGNSGKRGSGSDFEKAYQQWTEKNPGGSRAQFRQGAWLKQKEWSVQQVLMYDRYERRHNKLQDTIEDLDMKLSQIDPAGKSEDSFIQGMRKQLERKKRDLELTQSKMDGMLGTEKAKAREYQTAEEVRNDFINGDITEEEAAKILRSTFKYK